MFKHAWTAACVISLLAGCGDTDEAEPSGKTVILDDDVTLPDPDVYAPAPPDAAEERRGIRPQRQVHPILISNDEVEKYLNGTADVNDVDILGETLLHLAAAKGDQSRVRLLIRRGADVNIHATLGHTPLHLAARNGRAEVARVLIEHGADVNAKDKLDRTPLHSAGDGGHIQIMRLLLENGADGAARDVHGKLPKDIDAAIAAGP